MDSFKSRLAIAERLRSEIVFAWATSDFEAFSRRDLDRKSWDYVPAGRTKGRANKRDGRWVSLSIPAKEFYRYAHTFGIDRDVISGFFGTDPERLSPGSGQTHCYRVEIR